MTPELFAFRETRHAGDTACDVLFTEYRKLLV